MKEIAGKRSVNKKKPTMSDVAKLAGVSQATVSYVINQSAPISPEVKTRVEEAIRQLDYTPNALAQNLKSRRSRTIGLLLPTISNPFYSNIANYAENALRQNNYVSLLACTHSSSDAEALCLNEFLSYNVAGVVIAYSLVDKSLYKLVRGSNIPLIVLDDRPNESDVPSIEVDNEYGGFLATQHLAERGYKHIAIVSEPLTKLPLVQRITGWERALSQNKLDGQLVLTQSGSEAAEGLFEVGYHIGLSLIGSGHDAIFATSDYLALGILRCLLENKVHVPRDVALIGYDDIYAAQMSTPSLSTIAQPIQKMVEIGVKSLLAQIAGQEITMRQSLSPLLVARESTLGIRAEQ